jgi:ectoine hydroxylase-related dioxygenase (phytanoyl-CoA dioxygenase family)
MGLEPHVGITAWVALSNADERARCMRMIPGSLGVIRTHDDKYGEQNILTRGQEVRDVEERQAAATPLQPGQMSIHSATFLHSSQPNRSNDRWIGFVIQSYIPPSVRQTVMQTGAQLVRGTDVVGHFEALRRPASDMDSADIAKRDWVNEIWSDILYQGAEKRRDY